MITHTFPPYDAGGGLANNLMRYAETLYESGFDLTVVCGWSPSTPFFEDRGYRVLRVHFWDVPPRQLWFQIQNRQIILQLASEADVVLAFWQSSALLSKNIISMGVPLIVRVASCSITDLKEYVNLPVKYMNLSQTLFFVGELPMMRVMEKNDIAYSTHLIFDSRYMLNEIQRAYNVRVREKSTVIHNKVRKRDVFEPTSHELRNQIVFVGRLVATKGIQDLINALSILFKDEDYRSWKLIIMGDGPLKRWIQKEVDKRGLSGNVILLGVVPSQRVFEEENGSKIFVLPSYNEGNSVALSEAMTVGLPVIVPLLPWAIEQTDGYKNRRFFVAGNSVDLAAKIKEVISNLPARGPWNAFEDEETIADVVRKVV